MALEVKVLQALRVVNQSLGVGCKVSSPTQESPLQTPISSPPPISTPPTGSPPTQPCPTPLRRLHHQKDASNRLQRPNDATKVPAAKAAADGLPSPRQGCCQRATAKDTSDRPQPEQPVGVVIGVRVAAG
ncbi:hypothetical protein PGT21_014222 [Puccinia graminis f. sp. tritici]|uniref:Uncharacterized protein n=1 Tax=Puccinia graminis f. sp. tritici TaxID=56615 RepID=A0A5B0PGN4_PUCGR|nr:hypothetical protein PGTUg99_008700 [Puccinia graminis f. sp. tritici]KAA1099598.1 hypothetical protein PGT21_014222 [Puccinia graminis f. sp. tritici]